MMTRSSPDLGAHVGDASVQDAVGIGAGAARGVALGRDAEEHDAAHAQLHGLARRPP